MAACATFRIGEEIGRSSASVISESGCGNFWEDRKVSVGV